MTSADFAASLVRQARDIPGAHVLYATTDFTPTPASVLEACEQNIGAALPPAVRAFYSGATWLGLVWQKGAGEETTTQPKDWGALSDLDSTFWRKHIARDHSTAGGMVCIPRADEVFRKGYWLDRTVPAPYGDTVTIDDDRYTDTEVYNDLYPFDFIGNYYCAALWFNRRKGEWRVLFGSDHGASWFDYKTMSVDDYFEILNSTFGNERFVTTSSGRDGVLFALRAE